MNFLKSSIAGTLLISALTAHAALVNVWGYSVESVWTAAAPAGVTTSGDLKTLSWGTSTGSGQSSLVISTDPEGTVTTYLGGGAVPTVAPYVADGNTLTHNNNPITGTSLQAATLKTTLNLFASGVSGGGVSESPIGAPAPLNLDIAFWETPNGDPISACPIPDGSSSCDDIFVLLTPLQNQSFVYDGETYFVNVFPKVSSLGLLPTAACEEITGLATCYGFHTPEGDSTPLQFAFTVSTEPLGVPEPGVLALVALAMVGAGYSLRKQRQV